MSESDPDLPIPVCLAAVVWDFPLVGRTRMMCEAMSALGRDNLFVQIPSARNALEHLTRGSVAVSKRTRIVRPRALPRPGRLPRGSAARRAARRLRRHLDGVLQWERAVALVVNPAWAPWLDELPFGRVIYDCIDDVAVHTSPSSDRALFDDWEQSLIERAHGAVVTAEVLRDSLLSRRADLPVRVIRNGVDAEGFEDRFRRGGRPSDLPTTGRPLVGFVGALYEWIDWDLIGEVARSRPDWDFLFVGPTDGRSDTRVLAGLANVSFLGPRPYGSVPSYLGAFDVCWVPFRIDAVGAAANPVKLYEYLALGRPVVSSPVADLESFEGLVAVARDASEHVDRLQEALEDGSSDAPLRKEFARKNSWTSRAREFLTFLDGATLAAN